jgi:signal transduction histidine kinase
MTVETAAPLGSRAFATGNRLLTAPTQDNHIVQFYDSEPFLHQVVSDFIGTGLEAGEPILVIATPEHVSGFIDRLAARGYDVETARASGQLLMLDAATCLSQFLVDGKPEWSRFESVVGTTIARAQSLGCHVRVRAYGEMVDLLWQEGNARAALSLEQHWERLRRSHAFSLLCAYRMRGFEEATDQHSFESVCHAHSHVIPDEGYSVLEDSDERLREVAALQQRARALETEVRRRETVEKELREALDVRDKFLAVAGHELKTPLTPLMLKVEILALEAAAQPDSPFVNRVRAYTSSAARQFGRLSGLVNDLLDVSRISAGRFTVDPTNADLAEIVRDVTGGFEAHAAKVGSTLTVDSPPTLPGRTDPQRLEQVVTNLVDNALKYGAQRPVRVRLTAHEETALLTVSDGGIGIPKECLGRIFDRFERAVPNQSFGGMGLGLYISREVVSLLGGRISVESEPGQGSTFTVELPLRGPC